MRNLLVLVALLAVLAGCEQAATPLPVAMQITDTPAPTSEIPRLRFAYSIDALATFARRDSLANDADITIYDPQIDFQTPYDVVVVLGESENTTLAPQRITISLIVDTSQPPLDDPDVERLVRLAFDPTRLAEAFGFLHAAPVSTSAEAVDPVRVRTDLANLGYPDGLPLTIWGDHLPRSEALADLLRPFGINMRLILVDETPNAAPFPSGDVNAVLTSNSTTWLAQIDAANLIDLYSVPISYRAANGIALTFDAQGFPVLEN